MGGSVLGLEDDAVRFVGGASLLLVLAVLVVLVAGERAQTGQAGGVRLRSRGESRLGIGVLGMLWSGVAINQSIGLGNLVRSLELLLLLLLLRGKVSLLVNQHGVDGRAHGLGMVAVRNGGGAAPALGRLCSRGQRTRGRSSSCSVCHAAGARALARAWLGLGSAASYTRSVHGVIGRRLAIFFFVGTEQPVGNTVLRGSARGARGAW